MNALVGFQLIDDGTPASIGLISASAIALFIGTGYIALDTAFSWTGHFDSSLTGNNRNIGLYVLYQLFPLICLVLFFLLETVLVLRVLGELRPMCMSSLWPSSRDRLTNYTCNSLPCRRRPALRHRSDLPVRDQYASVSGHIWENQRRFIRNPVHPPLRHWRLGLLEQYHRRRLAPARRKWL